MLPSHTFLQFSQAPAVRSYTKFVMGVSSAAQPLHVIVLYFLWMNCERCYFDYLFPLFISVLKASLFYNANQMVLHLWQLCSPCCPMFDLPISVSRLQWVCWRTHLCWWQTWWQSTTVGKWLVRLGITPPFFCLFKKVEMFLTQDDQSTRNTVQKRASFSLKKIELWLSA